MTLTLLAALAIAVQATAEPYGPIAGTIRDEETGAPLAGVSVAVGGLTGFVIAVGRHEIRAALDAYPCRLSSRWS